MKGKNKKTKVKMVSKPVRKPAVKKSKKIKKVVRAKKSKENILGANFQVAQDLGKKINVVEIKEEVPEILQADFAPQDDNLDISPEAEDEDSGTENIPEEPEAENEQPQEDAVLETNIPESDTYSNEEDENMPKKDLTPLQKNIIMYAGITCVMAALVVFWSLSIKASFSQNLPTENYLEEIKSQDLIDQMKDTIDGVKDGLSQAQNLNQNTDDLQAVKEKIIETQIKNEIADQLKDKLENIDNVNINSN